MTIAGWIFFGAFIIRGITGFVQDANFWYRRPINEESFKEWLNTFKRNK